MKLRLRCLTDEEWDYRGIDDCIPIGALSLKAVPRGRANQKFDPCVLEFYGELPQAPDYDGPTISGWQPVPIDRGENPAGEGWCPACREWHGDCTPKIKTQASGEGKQ